jgi:UDP-N-acetylmuramoyl-tripeptide--D-alanyl-D-alanine ligase
LSFGFDEGRDARMMAFTPDPAGGSIAHAEILGKAVRYRIGAAGAHWAGNSLAALLAVAVLGADLDAACAALERFTAPAGRGAVSTLALAGGAVTLIDDSYNANPTSMAAALTSLGARLCPAGGRRIAALGDMLELGPEERAYHANLAAPIAQAGIDLVFCAGPRMRALWDGLPAAQRGAYAETADALTAVLQAALSPGDVVLVKGSNGSKMHALVAALKQDGGA